MSNSRFRHQLLIWSSHLENGLADHGVTLRVKSMKKYLQQRCRYVFIFNISVNVSAIKPSSGHIKIY